MALDKTNLIQLAKTVARADKSAPVAYSWEDKNYTYSQMNEVLRQQMNEYAGTYALYRENKNLIFALIEEVISDVLPQRMAQNYGSFAEVRVYNQGDKPVFRRRVDNRTRAKQFITRVGLAGVYEVFKLGGEESFEVPMSAIGGAAQIGMEEFLDGRVDFGELIDVVMTGMDELIYHEVVEAMKAGINQLPTANQVTASGFDEDSFDKLLAVAGAYGDPTIYCTFEFAVRMIPQEAWRYSDSMKNELWTNGRLTSYKGHRVIILPQYFTDETNSTKVVDPGYAWIIPSGGDNRPVKIAMEGDTLVDEWKNHDWSREVQVYKKVGVIALLANNTCVYKDTSLAGQMENWYFESGMYLPVVVEGEVTTKQGE